MRRYIRKRISPRLTPLNTIQVHRQRILDNLAYLQSLQPTATIFPVLKSNAYGHGLHHVSAILKDIDSPYLCVDSFPEYQIVKDATHKKVLVLGETLPQNYRYYNHRRATLVVYTLHALKFLANRRAPFSVHLFLNTGMNREGIQIDQLKEALQFFQDHKNLTLEGVMSHLANADEVDSSFTATQIATYKSMYALIEQAGFRPTWRYIGNSAGIAKIKDDFFNAYRSGIALYGYNHLHPSDAFYTTFQPLQPALRALTTVVSIQHLNTGDAVSYGGRFVAPHAMQTATIPFGYHEGLDRRLTNTWSVKRHDQYLPLIGAICMNLSCLDTQGQQVEVGDSIEVISNDPSAPNSLRAFAEICGTIPYEILVKLDSRMRREIVD